MAQLARDFVHFYRDLMDNKSGEYLMITYKQEMSMKKKRPEVVLLVLKSRSYQL